MKTNRGSTHLHLQHALALISLATMLWAGTPVRGQGLPSASPPVSGQSMPTQDNDARNWQIATMDQLLDSHPEVAEQLRRDPSLIRNEEFVGKHPALQEFLQQHPGIREEFVENPAAFMRREERFDQREEARFGDRDITREKLANMDRFLDSHPEIAEQLRKDPSLINNQQFVEKHPQLQEFLQTHPGVREELRENPAAFMRQEQRFDQREEARFGDRDMTRGELANMDRFLDGHPEIAEQLRKDPSLINNHQWVENHPQLEEFLEQHPGVREEFRENPVAFMQAEQRFDRHEDFGRDRDPATFGGFLSNHSVLAAQLSKDPSLVNNKEWMASHPELQDFLQSHPAVTAELTKNPQAFMSSLPPATLPPAATKPSATRTMPPPPPKPPSQ